MTRGFAPLILFALFLTGCGGRTEYTPPKTYPVKGKVLSASGEVLKFGRVTFHPKNKDDPTEPWADINKDGIFTVTSFKHQDGAAPGQYVVTVEPYSYRTGNLEKRSAGSIPNRYQKAETSDLNVEIKPQDNTLELRFKGS
jgi:hypothetical protein